MIKIVYLKPHKKPVIKEIEQEEVTLQRLVCGPLAVYGPFPGPFSIVYNQEAEQRSFPINRFITDKDGNILDTIKGNIIVCNVNDGQFYGLPEEQLENIVKMFESENVFTKLNGRTINIKDSSKKVPTILDPKEIDNFIRITRDKVESELYCLKRGMITEDELYERAFDLLKEGLYEFFTKKGISVSSCPEYSEFPLLHRYCFRESAWKNFSKEYSMYKQGEDLIETDNTPWLRWGDFSATAEDRTQWFRIMDALCLSPELFEPLVVTDVSVPNELYSGPFSEYSNRIPFDCEEDGGLLKDEDPVGKAFVLRNKLGLAAHITVTERSFNKWWPYKSNFKAIGSIDGYTAQMPRECPKMLITQDSFSPTSLCLDIKKTPLDQEVYRDYPLWQEYFKKSMEFRRMKDELLMEAVKGIEQLLEVQE